MMFNAVDVFRELGIPPGHALRILRCECISYHKTCTYFLLQRKEVSTGILH